MSLSFFYLSPAHWGNQVVVDGQERCHMADALRLAAGDEVGLLDGEGRSGRFVIERVDKNCVLLTRVEEWYTPPPTARAVMALALSKATRRGFFMEKAVELGAFGVWLWQADHSQGKLSANAAQACRGQMIAGAKQCANPWLPQVRTFESLGLMLEACGQAEHRILPWEMQTDVPMLTPDMAGQAGLSVYVVGPEGGFSPRELALLRDADFQAVSLGARVLRCETAATLCLGIHWWAAQLPGRQEECRTAGADA